ncbi:MAG: LTA synthase family protein [Candidatus Eremiobacterota bacterium]
MPGIFLTLSLICVPLVFLLRVPSRVAYWFPAIWLCFSLSFKGVWALQLVLDRSLPHPPGLAVWGALNLAMLGVLFSLAPRMVFQGLCWLGNLVISLCLLADRIYYRAFEDITSFCFLEQLQFVDRVSATVHTLLVPSDAFLLVDLPLALLVFHRLRKVEPPPLKLRRAVQFAVVIAAVAANVAWGLPFRKGDMAWLLRQRFKNVRLAEVLGVINYHLYDMADVAVDRWQRQLAPPPPLGPLQEAVEVSRQSVREDTPFKGVARAKNVLILQVESLQSFVIDLKVGGQEVTPFLNRMRRQGLYSDYFFDETHTGVSSDCDFTLLNSLYPAPRRPACFEYATNRFRSLPTILREKGYFTYYVHPYDPMFYNYLFLSGRYGYQRRLFFKDLPPPESGDVVGWGFSDLALLERVTPQLDRLPRPFLAHVVCVMGHHPFAELRTYQKQLTLPPKLKNTIMGNYLQMCRYRDSQLEWFFDRWLQSPLAQDTVVVFLGDHATIFGLRDLRLVRHPGLLPALESPMRLRVPFFIYVPGQPGQEIPGPTGHVDVAPTLLHLLGIEDAAPAFLGRNMFSRTVPPLAVLRKPMAAVDSRHLVLLSKGDTFDYRARRQADPDETLKARGLEILRVSEAITGRDLIPRLLEGAAP